MEVAVQLAAFGEMRHGGIGVVLGKVSQEASATAGTDNWDGALIVAVDPGSPAASAGLKQGDVVTEFNGRHVRSPNILRTFIGVSSIGSPLVLKIMRSGERLQVTLSTQPIERPSFDSVEQLGATIREPHPSEIFPDGMSGLVVEKVHPGSAAEKSGLIAGDMILAVNDETVDSLHLCDRLVAEANGRVRLIVFRSGFVRPIMIIGS